MDVLFVAAEVAPFSKTGGLGDVTGALPRALAARGHRVLVFTPRHGVIDPGEFHFIEGDAADPAAECRRVGALLARQPVDVAFVGIGENGHLAFNDPPADFDTETPYLVVGLDEACRRQQMGEGWFAALEEVPERAISMSSSFVPSAPTPLVG